MIITVDEAIPYWKEAFSGLGETRPFSGRSLKKETVLETDVLVVRSITPVGAPLLQGSSVRFVASASAGTDHIDIEYLKAHNIGFEYAQGCNANSVSEYVAAALSVFASRKGWDLRNKSIAVIGVGNVGSRVAQKSRALGMEVLLCDPPLRNLTGDLQYKDLEEVLGADFLSFHVPLVRQGPYPTFHMLNRKILDRLSPNQVLINTSRGAVFDNPELKAALRAQRIDGAILDVWEDEPQIDYTLLNLVDIGTPHIAGSSLDGKIRATEMVCEAVHAFCRIPSPWNGNSLYSDPEIIYPERGTGGRDAVASVLLQAYDILEDDRNLRKLGSAPSISAAGTRFDRLRSQYSFRPEFRHYIVALDEQHIQLSDTFESLGFQVRQSAVT